MEEEKMSEKSKTNKKWISTEKYRESYDKVFSKWKDAEKDRARNPKCPIAFRAVGLARIALECVINKKGGN